MVDRQLLAASYAESRSAFLHAAALAGASIETRTHPSGRGPDGGELAIDTAWLGPTDATKVVLVVSGTHGVEGFAGSALQTTWLRSGPEPVRPADTAVLLLHALNPYGFAWVRRVNEDNIDLNRNFVDFTRPLPPNPGYDEIADLLVPAEWDEPTRNATTERLLEHAMAIGMEAMQQTVSTGQFDHPSGLFYGGTGPTWSHRQLRDICRSMPGAAEQVAILDLHTGLGPWGVGELISSDPAASDTYRRAVAWYGDDVTSLDEGDSVSATLTGEWLPRIDDWIDAEVTGVAIEYGIVDLLPVIQALRADAWLHAHGDPTGPEAAVINAELRAAFADDDPAWMAACWDRFAAVLDATFGGLTG